MIYKKIIVPIISYGSTWFKWIKFEYQFKLLRKMQRKILLSLSRAYRTTSSIKLLNLFGVIDIIEHLKLLNKEKLIRDKRINEQLVKQGYDFDYGEVAYKEFIWLILDHGPHREYLFRMGLDDDPECRFCGEDNETSEHLIFNCRRFRDIENSDWKEQEKKARLIAYEIYKL